MEEEIGRHGIEYPCVAGFGLSLNELQDFCLVIIENNVVIMPELNTAMHCGFSAYWVFSIKYLASAKNLLLFLERIVYDLPSSQHLPSNVVTTIDSVSKVCV